MLLFVASLAAATLACGGNEAGSLEVVTQQGNRGVLKDIHSGEVRQANAVRHRIRFKASRTLRKRLRESDGLRTE